MMRRVLLPVDGSRASRCAARHVVRSVRLDAPIEIHVLNVQPPLRWNISQFIGKPERQSYYRDESDRAVRPVCRILDEAQARYSVHAKVGPIAELIAATASRLGCDHIVIGTTRKAAITRAIVSSVTTQVLERASVPVVVIVDGSASKAERYAVPIGLGAALALLLYAAAD